MSHLWSVFAASLIGVTIVVRIYVAMTPGGRPARPADDPVDVLTPADLPARRLPSVLIINGEALAEDRTATGSMRAAGIETVYRSVSQLAFAVRDGRTHAYETLQGRGLDEFGLVQIAGFPRPTAALMNTISSYLAAQGRPLAGTFGIAAPTKLHQYVHLAQSGLPVPCTEFLPRHVLLGSFKLLAARLGLPFVLKAINSNGGRLNHLVHDELQFLRILTYPAHVSVLFLGQRYVPNNGTFRLLVLGDDVPIVMHRCATDGSHLTNTAQGGHATLFEPETFDAEVKILAVRAAALMGYDVAGVNVVQDRTTRKWFVLEANPSPAIGTGAFVAEKTRAYAAYLYRKFEWRRPRAGARPA
ncbi:RimK family alpha-L-glutamate ligase [Streptomyces sp. NPDC058548]|uniref:ATP-grasp domain-containing protein n=2 Tax=unclassified Streptomyces TaxID=2593676 RepID=UPI00365A8BB9